MSGAQINFLDEIIVDNFAGGGGASTGIELATGRVVDIAVNHDPDAILMHKTNHPHTRHFQASVWDVDPVEVCQGRPVGLAWFSPDCKHFSKAKGGKPVDKNIRGLAWIVLRWAGTVRPRVIILENVEEFQTWGPVRKGKPVKKLVGQTFHKWLEQLKNLGYAVEWRELVAADYGAPTTRKRFFLIARHDGRPIVWPKPTHAPADSPEVKSGKKKPWRSAAEIIDWSLPCPSIFDSRAEIKEKYGLSAQRPLRPNTMRRVARGVDKFVIKSADPFLVIVNHAGDFRGQEMSGPLQTVTAKHGYGVASPVMAPLTVTNTTNSVGAAAGAPVHTVTTAGNQFPAVSGKAVMRTAGRPGKVRRGQVRFRLVHRSTGKVRHTKPAGRVRPGPSAHVVAVCGDPGRGGGISVKEYFKNALIICAEMTLLVVCWGLAEFALAVLRIEIGLTNWAMGGFVLAAALIGAAFRTARERRRKERAAKYVPVVLESAINVQRSLLRDITASEDQSQINTWRKSVVKMTLAALNEKRERTIKNGAEK